MITCQGCGLQLEMDDNGDAIDEDGDIVFECPECGEKLE